jgi:hypothetical protein
VNVNKVYVFMACDMNSLDGRGITDYVNKVYIVNKVYFWRANRGLNKKLNR